MITKRSLRKFKAIYKKRFNGSLSEADTLRKATNLLNVYRAGYGDYLTYGIDRKLEDKKNKNPNFIKLYSL